MLRLLGCTAGCTLLQGGLMCKGDGCPLAVLGPSGLPPPCRHTTASESVQKAHDAAFRALNEAYQALMDGGCPLIRRRMCDNCQSGQQHPHGWVI